MESSQLFMLMIPVVVIDMGGRIAALYSLYKAEQVRFDNKWIWLLIIGLVSFLGWIGWFLGGRSE